MRHMRRMLRSGGRRMIRRERVVGSLSHHVISTRVAIQRLSHGRRTSLVSSVGKVRRRNLRTSLLRSITIVGARRGRHGRHRWHAVARHERLCLGVESMTVKAPRDGVLALWIVWISVGRKSTVSVGYAWCARWCGPGLIRALIEAGWRRRRLRLLPTMLRWWRTLHGLHIRCRRHGIHWRLVPWWTWWLGILRGPMLINGLIA